MKNVEFNYEENFIFAKESSVYAHAIVWIKAALDDKKTDREQFIEIKKVIDEAVKHI